MSNSTVFNGGVSVAKTDVATSATIDDLATPTAFIRLTGSTTTTISGFAGGTDGRILEVYNASTAVVKFTHNATSTAANRISTSTSGSVYLQLDRSARFIYDSTAARWVMMRLLTDPRVVTMTDAATIAVDASLLGLGDSFYLSTVNSPTFSIPTNVTDGQKIVFIIKATSSPRTPTFTASGAGSFSIGDTGTPAAIAASNHNAFGFQYNVTLDKWMYLAVATGFT